MLETRAFSCIFFFFLLSHHCSFYIERATSSGLGLPPDVPNFYWENIRSENGLANIKVVWQPALGGKAGSHFYVKYRVKDESSWQTTDPELYENYLIVHGINPDHLYEFRVVSVDGEYQTESATQEVDTYGIRMYTEGAF